jgi:predicted NBD/HSP70 family sugar kinase
MTTLCVDLGGMRLRAALLAAGGEVESLGDWPAPADMEAFRRRVAGLVDEHGASRIGVAVPGLASGSVCRWAPNLPYLDGVDLARIFPGVTVALGNDAQLALLAEAARGAARNATDVILLAIGTGIGSAVLADGRIVRGPSGAAASFGWASADPADPGDPNLGWLERNPSGTALDAIARRAGLMDARALIAAARAGDRAALKALEKPCAALGASIAGAVALLGSQSVIVSGGVAEAIDALAPLILPVLKRHLPPHLRDVTLAPAEFGARASLIGAGLAAHGHPLWAEKAS